MISSEVAPFARTGGLGDVLGGLPSALADLGCDVIVVTPRYGVTKVPAPSSWWETPVRARIGWGPDDVRVLGVLETTFPGPDAPALASTGVRVCLLDHPDLFWRDGIYGDAHGTFGDNDVRFVAMSRGALAVAEQVWGPPGPTTGLDVIHAHDWHAAPAIVTAKLTMGHAWAATPAVFTIHNLAFQGVLGHDALDRLALPRAAFDDGTLAHDGQVNLLAGAIALADRVTTVSPTYAREILGRREGCGLEGLLRRHAGKLRGIVNGIDQERFDPATDPALAEPYGAAEPFAGKAACKAALLRELGLDAPETALFASVCRLTEQKGVDLLLALVPGLVERGASFALVGSGDARLEEALRAAERRFPGRVGVRIAFDDGLARRIYAGADFVVVPSRYEPCGLTQLYAMRYGAIPVVTSVGGLRDTVTPISAVFEEGTGLCAPSPTAEALLVACEDALALYRDVASHQAAVRRAMSRDSSWREPARAYMSVYASLGRPSSG
jgi:starch synthase